MVQDSEAWHSMNASNMYGKKQKLILYNNEYNCSAPYETYICPRLLPIAKC